MVNNGRNGRKRRRWIWFGGIGLLLLVVIVGVSAAFRSNTEIDPSKLATVEKGDIARSVVATGKIEPLAKVEVKSKASGIVKQIFVDYGDTVKQGQVLAELDKEELSARVREARATLQAAQAAQEAEQADRRAQQRLRDQSGGGARPGAGGPDASGTGARRGRPAQLHHRQFDERAGALARHRGRRRCQLHSRPGLASHFGDDPRGRQRGVRERQGGRGRYRQGLHRPDRAHLRRVHEGKEVSGQTDQDFSARRGEGQRHYLRGARLDSESLRRAEGDDDRERRDHPGGKEGRAADA